MLDHRAEDREALTSRVVRMKTLSGFMFFSEAVLCRFEISPLIQWVTSAKTFSAISFKPLFDINKVLDLSLNI